MKEPGMGKVFLVCFDVGSYSDREQGILKAFSSMEKAEAYVDTLCTPPPLSDEEINNLYLAEVARLEDVAAKGRLQAQAELNDLFKTRQQLAEKAERIRLEKGLDAYAKALKEAQSYGSKQEPSLMARAVAMAPPQDFSHFRSVRKRPEYYREDLSIESLEVE